MVCTTISAHFAALWLGILLWVNNGLQKYLIDRTTFGSLGENMCPQ